MTEYRLIHFNSARPLGDFSMENAFVRTFLAVLPRIFGEADTFDGLNWHNHGVRRPDGRWLDVDTAFPYPDAMDAPDICTMAGWTSLQHMRSFVYEGRTHPPGMRRLANELDRSKGPGFVMWWAPRGARFTMENGWEKLSLLRTNGPSHDAFSLDSLVDQPKVA